MNETEFKRFVMIIKSAGFIRPWMIRSKNALNFAYLLYLTLRDDKIDQALIESYVKRWFVMSILTGRSSGSFESQFDYDIKQLAAKDFGDYLREVETAELGDAFWDAALPMALNTSSTNSPFWYVFLAAQVKAGDKGFLSRDIRVEDMIEHRGDTHHIFPKDYLKRNGLTRGKYNQIANFVYMQSEINIKVGNKAPDKYMGSIREAIANGSTEFGSIAMMNVLDNNLVMNAIPSTISELTA
jgi:hypothetical protein